MRILYITLWLLIPLVLAAYHFGPGQQLRKMDLAQSALKTARQAVSEQEWSQAVVAYQEALSKLSKDEVETATRIRIEIAKAQMQSAGLPEAREDLIELVGELREDKNMPADVLEEALSSLANARYYMTYLMKLEGQAPSVWEPEIEAARQEYKLLAQVGNDRDRHLNDLEAAIRLARAEPKELYGLPIPKP